MSKILLSKIKTVLLISIWVINSSWAEHNTQTCAADSVKIQVHGSGGPELTKHRASSSLFNMAK